MNLEQSRNMFHVTRGQNLLWPQLKLISLATSTIAHSLALSSRRGLAASTASYRLAHDNNINYVYQSIIPFRPIDDGECKPRLSRRSRLRRISKLTHLAAHNGIDRYFTESRPHFHLIPFTRSRLSNFKYSSGSSSFLLHTNLVLLGRTSYAYQYPWHKSIHLDVGKSDLRKSTCSGTSPAVVLHPQYPCASTAAWLPVLP